MQKIFEFTEDEESGMEGWLPLGAPPTFNTGEGVLIAHDCLEHYFPNDDGRIHFEFMALGAAVVVRTCKYYVSAGSAASYHTPHEHTASEWSRLIELAASECDMMPEPPGWRPCSRYEHDIVEVVELARRHTKMGYRETASNYGDGPPEKKRAFKRKAEGWFREGVRRARRRYRDCPDVLAMFKAIETRSSHEARHATCGDVLVVEFTIRTAKVRVTRLEYFETDPALMTPAEIRWAVRHT